MRRLSPALALWGAAMTLAAPALRLALLRRVGRGKEIGARLGERRGLETTRRPAGPLLWLHAASVGEAVSILPVIASLPAQLVVLLTTGTVTSARLLERRLPELGWPGTVLHRFVPLDVPRWVGRFLDHWRPQAAGLVESELWPNLIEACRRRAIPVGLVNARLSPRSAGGWARVPGLASWLLGSLAFVAAQSEADAARFAALGATRVDAPGNLKFAAAPLAVDARERQRLARLIGARPVWLAASTHPGEEQLAAALHDRLAPVHPGLLTIIAPRHPERGASLAAALGAPRRGAGEDPPREAGLWLVDTLGELGLLYRLAGSVFVGRSLVGAGGQNPLEPARLGCAVCVGPHTGNFEAVCERLARSGGLARVADADGLGDWVDAMLRDPAARQRAGEAAAAAASGDDGLPALLAARLLGLVEHGAAAPG